MTWNCSRRPFITIEITLDRGSGFPSAPILRLRFEAATACITRRCLKPSHFVARVLDGAQIAQVFVPLAGLPSLGVHATSAQVWSLGNQRNIFGMRTLTAADLATLGLRPGVTPPVLLRTDRNLVNPYNQQFSLAVDRAISGLSVSANYIGNRGVKLIRSRNVNLKQTGTNGFGPVFGPIDPAVLQDNRVESSGSSIYHGFVLSASKRYGNRYQLQASLHAGKSNRRHGGFHHRSSACGSTESAQ